MILYQKPLLEIQPLQLYKGCATRERDKKYKKLSKVKTLWQQKLPAEIHGHIVQLNNSQLLYNNK